MTCLRNRRGTWMNRVRRMTSRARQCQSLGADYPVGVCFDDLGLSIDHQPQRSSERHHRERLERSVQCKTSYDQAPSVTALLQRSCNIHLSTLKFLYYVRFRRYPARHQSSPAVPIGEPAFGDSHVLFLDRET